MLARYVAGIEDLILQARFNADMNASGVVDVDDITLLSRCVGGIDICK